jgi:hypothetical protein
MGSYIFLTDEGYTYQPNSDSDMLDIENLQVKGDLCVVDLYHNEKIDRNLLCVCCQKTIKQKSQGRARRFWSAECRRKC